MNISRTPDSLRDVLPSEDVIEIARSHLFDHLPSRGLGEERLSEHLKHHVVSGSNRASESPHYYGFVTGGATPVATLADNIVTKLDNSPQVHLPKETIVTDVEDRALRMVCELIDVRPQEFRHRTFTTGATASNVVGLACGREYVIQQAARRQGLDVSVGEEGISKAMRKAGLDDVQILTTVPHSSLRKAASIVGLGRASVIDVGLAEAKHRFDLGALEGHLKKSGIASIVAVSCAEVNTGLFATDGAHMQRIRDLCHTYGAWLHVDAAFGLLARVLPDVNDYCLLREGVAGLELADSIAGDAHKLLNVPYDCGIFFSRHLRLGVEVFQNPNAVYLNTASSETDSLSDTYIPSPLNIGIENSRRFRALPVYASLAAYGRHGYQEMLQRQVRLARSIAEFMIESGLYEVLPVGGDKVSLQDRLERIYIIVLFRAKEQKLNEELVQRVKATRRIYISGTQWEGKSAARFAVANWQADDRDLSVVKEVLMDVARR